jgi:hypothetical protein
MAEIILLKRYQMIHRLVMIWRSEHIPAGWRKWRVVNLFRAGDATLCGNYILITLLQFLDKLFSSILTTRLMQQVPLQHHQYAFRKHRVTHHSLSTLASAIQARKHAGLSTYAFSPRRQGGV